MIVPFTKMSGAGNDFVVIDRRTAFDTFEAAVYAPVLCDRRRGIGADGVIVLKASAVTDFTMEYYNADGSTGSMCGNGGRCAAALVLGEEGGVTTSFEACGNVHSATRTAMGINLGMADPGTPRMDIDLGIRDVEIRGHFINTGSPHLVLMKDSPGFESMEIVETGRKIRHSKHFEPGGTNVDYVQVVGEGHIAVRTYERGVEDETLACGTGAVAAAVIYDILSGMQNEWGKRTVRVTPRSGESLMVNFTREAAGIRDVHLEGPAVVTFTGSFNTDRIRP